MKHSIWLIIIIISIAVPVFAQDDGGSFEGGGAFETGGRFDAGDRAEGVNFDDAGPIAAIQSVQKVDPLADLRNWLARASAPPIEKKQAKLLKSLYDSQLKVMAIAFEQQNGVTLDAAIAAQSRSLGRRGVAARPANPALSAAITRLKNQLSDKIIASLRMDQQAPLRKFQSEELRNKEVSLLQQKLKAAGIFLSAEQESKVDAAYARESYLRALVIIEAKGEPYDDTMTILSKQTTLRVVQALDSTQIALLSSVSKTKTP